MSKIRNKINANIGNENDFFNLTGGEPQLSQEGDTGDYLDIYFSNSFFNETYSFQ